MTISVNGQSAYGLNPTDDLDLVSLNALFQQNLKMLVFIGFNNVGVNWVLRAALPTKLCTRQYLINQQNQSLT